MKDKSILKKCMIYGIQLSLFTILISCVYGEVDCKVEAKFSFINETDFKLETGLGIIEPNGSLMNTFDDSGPCNILASDFMSPLYNSSTIILNDTLCKTYLSSSPTIGEGPLGIANFTSKKVAKNNYEFTYTFRESEFTDIQNCN